MSIDITREINIIAEAEAGDILQVPAVDPAHVQSLKMRYYRGLKAYEKRTGIDSDVIISMREGGKFPFSLIMTKQPPIVSYFTPKGGMEVPLTDLLRVKGETK